MFNAVLFQCLTSEQSIHYVLANLLLYSWVLSFLEGGLRRHTVLATP